MAERQAELDRVAARLGALRAAEMALKNAIRQARQSGATDAEIQAAMGAPKL